MLQDSVSKSVDIVGSDLIQKFANSHTVMYYCIFPQLSNFGLRRVLQLARTAGFGADRETGTFDQNGS